MTLITPAQKDAVLAYLCNNADNFESLEEFETSHIFKELNISSNLLDSILTYFSRHGYIREYNNRNTIIFLIINMEANDLYRAGGFLNVEIKYKGELEKLLLELETLKKDTPPDKLDKVEKISSIGSAIFQILTSLIG